MTNIYINDVAYDHIIDTNFGEEKDVSMPEWINQDPEIDTNVWSGTPLIIIYTLRVTDAKKYVLDQLLTAHQKIYIEDDTYNIDADAWIRSINARWEGEVDYTNPWLIEIELVIINMLEGDYSTWTEIWQWSFPEDVNNSANISVTLSPEYIYIAYDDGSGDTRFAILNIADASTKFLSPLGSDYQATKPENSFARGFNYNSLVSLWSGGTSFSIRGKYVILTRYDTEYFEVWKDGVKVFTSPAVGDVVTDAEDWALGLIRYDGKYIIMITYDALEMKIVCFEGS